MKTNNNIKVMMKICTWEWATSQSHWHKLHLMDSLQRASFKKGFPLQGVLFKVFLMNAVYFQGALFKNVRVNDVPFQGVGLEGGRLERGFSKGGSL